MVSTGLAKIPAARIMMCFHHVLLNILGYLDRKPL